MKNPDNIYDSIESLIAFSARDYSVCKRDAWLYGIVHGWGECLEEIAKKHKWDSEDCKRLKLLNKQWDLERVKYNEKKSSTSSIKSKKI